MYSQITVISKLRIMVEFNAVQRCKFRTGAYKKRGELLRVIASEKNFINLHSPAFDTDFGHNLFHAYKFCIFQKTAQ